MKDLVVLVLLAVAIAGWALYLTGRDETIVGTTTHDTTYTPYAVQLPAPDPILIQGKPDTVTVVDSSAVDSIARAFSDSLAVIKHLSQKFFLVYSDSIQDDTVHVDPLRKSGLFNVFYKKFTVPSLQINHTAYVSSDSWLQAWVGGGWRSDSAKFYFFVEGRIRTSNTLTLHPRASTDGLSIEARYRLFE